VSEGSRTPPTVPRRWRHHDATRPAACEVASGLEATRRDRDKASAPLPPEEDAAQPPGAAAGQAGNPLPPGDAPVTTVRPKARPSDGRNRHELSREERSCGRS